MAPGAVLSRRGGNGAAEDLGRRLRHALTADGPLGAALALHLGSRVDLLSGTDCAELLAIPDRGPASRPEAVVGLVERSLRSPVKRLFATFSAEPFDSGLLFQWHRARLPGGKAVTVQVVHPELEPEIAAGRPGRLAARLVAAGLAPEAARQAASELELRLDLERTAGALARLREETSGSRWARVPVVHQGLCAPRLLVLSELRRRLPGAASNEPRARRLARTWLSLALLGDLFPVEPMGRNLAFLEGGRVAFLGGPVHRLPRALRGKLREYLAAVATHDPARAAMAFLELLPGSPNDRRLRDRIRHTDPFRDRGWDVGGDLFARQVLAQRRSAEELGYRPPEGLEPFYRGLFLLNHEVAARAAAGAPVRDGLREARLLLLYDELRREGEGGRWLGAMEHQVGLLSGLPRKLDRVLTLAAEPDRAERGEGRALTAPEPSGGSRWMAVAGCLLALTAVVLLTRHVAEAAAGPWPERLGSLLVMLLGSLALRAATRSGGG